MASFGLRGGFISMDIHTGEIIAMGSYPTFEPEVFTKPMTQAQVNDLYRDEVLAPLTDRAIAGLYPTGSTFKPITAIAALESDNLTPSEVIYDPGQLTVGEQTFSNAGEAANGSVSLVSALEVSSDVFFYTLGLRMWNDGQLQHWGHELGIGRPSGIDLPGATEGLLPSRQWRDQLYREGETERPWSAGDNVQLATGQGDLQTNPLQMAIAYAAIANGGTVVTPHVGLQVDDAAGRVVKEFDPGPRRHVEMDAEYREDILEGLHDAAQNGGGTSCDVFCNFPIEVAGKTGTAQRPPYEDQSWYGVLAPYPDPRIVTFVTMEEGGFGVEAAAPAARRILEAYLRQGTLGRLRTRRRRRRVMYATRARRTRPEPFTVRPGIAERLGLPYMDAALGFSAVALALVSIYTLDHATAQDVPGSPGYYTDRQTLYAIIGVVGMYLLSRIDYSRFRELRVGIYTLLCASVSLVLVFGFAARGSRRSFDLPFFSFQPSELGKLLLVLALAGFVIDGARRGSPWQRTVRYLCLGLAPAALVFLQPDLGTSLVFGAITLAVMYVGGVRWTHLAAITGGAGRTHRNRPLRRPRSRGADPEGVSARRG